MTPTLTRSDFQAALRRYLEVNKMNITALARRLGRGESTVGDWVRLGIQRDEHRQKVIEQYPQIFNSSPNSNVRSNREVSIPPAQPAVVLDMVDRRLLVLIKTEQVQPAILHISLVLKWFLFKASAEERNRFRDDLGSDWQNFLELTRAMTNETAFEVTKQEGRLEWCQK